MKKDNKNAKYNRNSQRSRRAVILPESPEPPWGPNSKLLKKIKKKNMQTPLL